MTIVAASDAPGPFTPPGLNSFPNEPGTHSLVAEYHGSVIANGHFDARKSHDCTGASDCVVESEITKGAITMDGNGNFSNFSVVQDATHPIDGEDSVTRLTFPNGFTGGGAPNFINFFGDHPAQLTDWCASKARPDGFELENMYYSNRFKLVSGPGDGTWEYFSFLKIPGYWGVGEGTSNAFGNQVFGFISHPNGDGLRSGGFNIQFEQQGPSSVENADQFEIVGGASGASDVIDVGTWYHLEQLLGVNDIGSANGTFKCWLNGTLLFDRSNCTWRTATHPRGFYSTHLNPVLGAPEDTKTRDDHIHYGHRRVSGIELSGVN